MAAHPRPSFRGVRRRCCARFRGVIPDVPPLVLWYWRVSQMRHDVNRQAEQLSPASWGGQKVRLFELPGALSNWLHILVRSSVTSRRITRHMPSLWELKAWDGVGRGLLGTPAYRYIAKTPGCRRPVLVYPCCLPTRKDQQGRRPACLSMPCERVALAP